MKYAITGGAGHISKSLIIQLLKAGQRVRVIGRNENHLKELIALGAETAIGSVEDPEFLKLAFNGMDAVYTMCPPRIDIKSLKDYFEKLGKNYAGAIEANGIKYVVNLSSVGAHLQTGAGHVSRLYRLEEILNSLKEVNIRHLRPVYFYTNLFGSINMIKNMGLMGGNFSLEKNNFPLVHPVDIAKVAAEELLALHFSGCTVRYIASDERRTDEIAGILGKAIGKENLNWIKFSDEQTYQGLLQSGFPEEIASDFVEGFRALGNGKALEDYWMHRPAQLGTVKLEDFANTFAEVYKKSL